MSMSSPRRTRQPLHRRRAALARAVACSLVATIAVGVSGCRSGLSGPIDTLATPGRNDAIWFCPMHPGQMSDRTGHCPICGMPLVAGEPLDTREYLLDVGTQPSIVRPGVPFTLTLDVRHPGTNAPVSRYEVVHDRPFHLFVISHDLNYFDHLHPRRGAAGAWEVGVTLPEPGYYRLLSDFLPAGGAPQLIGRTLVTAAFGGDLASQAARLETDRVFRKTVDGIEVTLEFDPPQLVAGQYGHLRLTLTDDTTRQPVTDLEPYLGAFGHTLIVSEDLGDAVHSHPTDDESDASSDHGGPRLGFEGYIPRAGRYRSWTQFQRRNRLSTVSFTFEALTLARAMRAAVVSPPAGYVARRRSNAVPESTASSEK
jgi:hypothetical protein